VRVREIPVELKLERDPTRTGGIHQSSIIKAIALRSGILDSRYAEEEDFAEMSNPLLVMLGLAWEDWASKHLHPDVTYHPGEVECDGIKQSVDGWSETEPDTYTRVWLEPCPEDWMSVKVNEFKSTHKSCKGLDNPEIGFRDQKFWMWIAQMMGYCHTFQTRWATLHVLFVRGDYKAFGPQYRVFEFEFTEEEIEDNWNMILAHKHLGREE
jgi:hypothetical protein